MLLTWTGTDGQAYLGDRTSAKRLSWNASDFQGDDGGAVLLPADLGSSRLFAQPCPNPAGTHIASFALPVTINDEGEGMVVQPGGAVFVLAKDGIDMVHAYDLEKASPVHLSWHPSGTRLRIVQQAKGTLELLDVDLESEDVQSLATGSPLFHSGDPRGRLLVHSDGDYRADRDARVRLIDPEAGTAKTLCSIPGTFPTALWSPDRTRVAYAMAGDGLDSALMVAGEQGEEARALMTFPGRGTMEWGPESDAIFVALGGDTDLHFEQIIAVQLSGSSETLYEGVFLAFWLLERERLLIAEWDQLTGMVDYLLLEPTSGTRRSVGRLVLTHEMTFATHFFDQFRSSHPNLSPDGRYAISAGYPVSGIEVDRSEPPQLWLLDLEEENEPIAIASAVFGCFVSGEL